MTSTEQQIIELFRKGDVRAMDLLYDHYGDNLYGIVNRITKDDALAQDVIQDAFIKIWKQSALYDSSKGRLFTWLLTIVRNQALDALRKIKRKNEIRGTAADVSLSVISAGNENLSIDHDVKTVLGSLDSHHRELLEHSYILGFSHPEIAEKFDIPLGTVKTRIRSAMQELRAVFGNGH